MNITALKTLVANLPPDCTPEQFSAVEMEIESLLATQRQTDEAMLLEIEQQAAKLREKLGIKRPARLAPATANVRVEGANTESTTDEEAGIPYDDVETSTASFRAELSGIRNRNVQRRRSREQH